MVHSISWEQLSDDALATLGADVSLDDLTFYLDPESEDVYCENRDDLDAWVWVRSRLEWEQVRSDWFGSIKHAR